MMHTPRLQRNRIDVAVPDLESKIRSALTGYHRNPVKIDPTIVSCSPVSLDKVVSVSSSP